MRLLTGHCSIIRTLRELQLGSSNVTMLIGGCMAVYVCLQFNILPTCVVVAIVSCVLPNRPLCWRKRRPSLVREHNIA